jgi:hypothetical protein
MSQAQTSLPAEPAALRDRLALDRTALANERSFLVYLSPAGYLSRRASGGRMTRTATLLFALVSAACSSAPPAPPEPQMLELSLGQTRRVMAGRASVWFAQPDEAWREDLNQIAEGARVEVACKGQTYTHMVYKDKPTDPVCGIRLQLLRLEEPDPGASPPRTFRAYFRVSVE